MKDHERIQLLNDALKLLQTDVHVNTICRAIHTVALQQKLSKANPRVLFPELDGFEPLQVYIWDADKNWRTWYDFTPCGLYNRIETLKELKRKITPF